MAQRDRGRSLPSSSCWCCSVCCEPGPGQLGRQEFPLIGDSASMYCKAGVACTNPEVYGDIKRGRRLAPSKGIVCPRCQGKCCNEACLEKHKCKQRARSSSSVGMGRAGAQHGRWQDPTGLFGDPASFLDPNMQLALARAGQGGLLLPQGGRRCQGHNNSTCMHGGHAFPLWGVRGCTRAHCLTRKTVHHPECACSWPWRVVLLLAP